MLTACVIVVILVLGLLFWRDWGDNKPGILTKVKLLITHVQVSVPAACTSADVGEAQLIILISAAEGKAVAAVPAAAQAACIGRTIEILW